MTEMLRPILEMLVVIPGMLIAYVPVQSYLKQRPRELILWLAPLTVCLPVLGGLLSYALHISTGLVILAVIVIFMLVYTKTLSISVWKSGNVFLAIVVVFVCVNSLARAINAIMTKEMNLTENELWFCVGAGILYNILCWACVFLVWYPAAHEARDLIEDDNLPITWKIFGVLPMVFIGINLFIIPKRRGILYMGRIMQGYIVVCFALFILLGLFYAMFLIIANNLNKNARLQQENQFLAMQQSRYDNLKSAIEETRQARHDLRHHFAHLSGMAQDGDLEKMKRYLSEAQNNIPNLDMRFSENRTVDSVIGHYCTLAHRNEIPFLPKIDLPADIPIGNMDMCLVLSNLLENALEASLRAVQRKPQIVIEIYMHSERLVLIQVQNTFDGEIKEKDGILRSSKRKGNGIGIQSVRRIAEKNSGDAVFTYDDGLFTARVMLRG